jgi:hypothetical protein
MANKGRGLASRTTNDEVVDKALRAKHPGRSLYEPEFCEKVRSLCKLGATDKDLALFFDVSYNTIENWKKQHPEFFVKILRGKQEADVEVVEHLHTNAIGYDYYEEVAVKLKDTDYDEKGKVTAVRERVETVRVLRHQPADTTAQIYWLKNRRPAEWRDAKQVEITASENLEPTQQGDSLLAELQSRGFVEIDGEYKIINPEVQDADKEQEDVE